MVGEGQVPDKDAMIYAANPWAIPFDHKDSDPPRLLQAGYTVGPPNVSVNVKAMKVVGSGYEFRGVIEKTRKKEGEEGKKIPTGVFQQKEYARLSGLLCSRAEAVNRPANFQFAPNLNATVRLPERFRLQGTYYATKPVENGYQVTPMFEQRAKLF